MGGRGHEDHATAPPTVNDRGSPRQYVNGMEKLGNVDCATFGGRRVATAKKLPKDVMAELMKEHVLVY